MKSWSLKPEATRSLIKINGLQESRDNPSPERNSQMPISGRELRMAITDFLPGTRTRGQLKGMRKAFPKRKRKSLSFLLWPSDPCVLFPLLSFPGGGFIPILFIRRILGA